MRTIHIALILTPLLLALPSLPAHEEGIQWNVQCFDDSPTSDSLTTLNGRAVGYTPAELAISGDRLIASRWSDGGFQMFSLANPAAPSPLATVFTSGTTLDVKPSTDGNTVYAGTFGRIHVVNVANPSAPSLIRTVGLPVPTVDQAHMLHVAMIDGVEHVFAASQSGSGVYIFETTGGIHDRGLSLVAQFAPGSPLAAHDMWVQHDPVLGVPVLYVANGFGGWIAADVSNPSLPVPLAVVPNPDLGQSYVHTVQAGWIDDRRIVATISELGGNLLRVWDATVIHAPILIGSWSVQSDLGVVPSASSQHNLQIVDGRLFVAHYLCGFYVFDLRTLSDLPVFAPLSPVAHFAPMVSDGQHWDVVLRNGYIYTSDMRMQDDGAIYTVAYDDLPQGVAAYTSTG